MSSVVARTFVSTPARDAFSTWEAIVDLLTQGTTGAKRTELLSVAGIAASVITEKGPMGAPIVVTCDGPRTRIYCLYDDDAVEGSDANEDVIGFDPLKGDWAVSLPCPADDLDWVAAALAGRSERITARDESKGIVVEAQSAEAGALEFDLEGFLGP